MFESIVNWFAEIPASTWYAFGEFFILGAGVSIFMQALKHVRSWGGKKNFLTLLTGGVSFVAALAVEVLNAGALDVSQLGGIGATIFMFATIVYRVSVSPLYKKFCQLLEDAHSYRKTSEEDQSPQTPAPVSVPPSIFEG